MMPQHLYIYLLSIPVIAVMAWACYVKFKQQKITDLVIISINSVAIIINGVLVYQMIISELSIEWHIVQMGACSIIIPLAYMYFSRQVGAQTPNSDATRRLWTLAALTFVPEILIFNPFEPIIIPEEGLEPFCLYVLSHGEKLFGIYTSDLIVILQCIIAITRLASLMSRLRNHHLQLNRNIYFFMATMALAIIFSVIVSSLDYEVLRSTVGSCFYIGGYCLFIILTNFLVAKGYDLYPVKTEEGKVVEDLEIYVQQQYNDMAIQLCRIMNEERLFLNPQLSADQIIERLHTNHTYFSQMMSLEWKMSFTDYVARLRLSYAEKLLTDPSLTISDVAAQSGFSDFRYMCRKFKAKHGITPTEWRKKQ